MSNAYRDEVRLPENDVLRSVQTAAAVRVSWDGELKGALSVGFYSMRRVTDDDLGYLQAIASLAAVASSNAEAFERAQTAARTDSLTGLLNHGAVHVLIREEIARARRVREPLCCLLMDLDNFKPVNDVHGHLVGDQVLSKVADAIREGSASTTAWAVRGRRVRPGAARGPRGRGPRDGHAPAGHGGRSPGRRRAGGRPDRFRGGGALARATHGTELLDRADRALLVAKGQGKDRYVVAGLDTDSELARIGAGAGAPGPVLSDLWDMVSGCRQPAEVLDRLAAFVQESLGLEEGVLVRDGDPPCSPRCCSAWTAVASRDPTSQRCAARWATPSCR